MGEKDEAERADIRKRVEALEREFGVFRKDAADAFASARDAKGRIERLEREIGFHRGRGTQP